MCLALDGRSHEIRSLKASGTFLDMQKEKLKRRGYGLCHFDHWVALAKVANTNSRLVCEASAFDNKSLHLLYDHFGYNGLAPGDTHHLECHFLRATAA